jgi:hypothetical protein
MHCRSISSRIRGLIWRAAVLPVATAGLGLLSGCQAVVTSTPQSRVRIIDASPDAGGLDIYEGSSALAYNLGFGTLTSYISFAPGNYTLAADIAGSRQMVSSSKASLVASAQYTVLIGNSAANLQQLVLTDQSQGAPTGQISLRFLDQATRIGAVDIYLVPAGQTMAGVKPLLTGVVFNTNTGYLNVPSGGYSVFIVPTGTTPDSTTVAAYSGTQITYASGAARTIVLIDEQVVTTPAPGLQVITADDFDSPTTTS